MKNQIKNTIKKLLATGLAVGLCASFAVSGAFSAPIEASAAEPITLYDTSGFVDYTSVPLKRDLGTEFQLPDIKRYRMTVKWTVEDANNDDGNYIKLYGYKLKETTTDEQSIYTDEIEEYTIRDAAKNGGEHTATVDMYSLPIKMTYHCHGSVANTSRWYITSLCIDTGDNNVNEWLNPEPSFGIAREEPFWDGKIGIEIEHFAGGDNGITLFFDKNNAHFGDWERDDVGDHKQAWTGSFDKDIYKFGTKPSWTFNPNENCTFHWNISGYILSRKRP